MKFLAPLGVLLAFSTAFAQHYPEGLTHQPSLRYLIQDKGIPFEAEVTDHLARPTGKKVTLVLAPEHFVELLRWRTWTGVTTVVMDESYARAQLENPPYISIVGFNPEWVKFHPRLNTYDASIVEPAPNITRARATATALEIGFGKSIDRNLSNWVTRERELDYEFGKLTIGSIRARDSRNEGKELPLVFEGTAAGAEELAYQIGNLLGFSDDLSGRAQYALSNLFAKIGDRIETEDQARLGGDLEKAEKVLREFKEHAEGKRSDGDGGDGGDSIVVAGNYSKYRAMIVLEDLKTEAPEAEWVAVLDGSDPKGWLKIRKAQPNDLIIKKWSCEIHHSYKSSNFEFEQRNWNMAQERIIKFEMPFFKGPDGKLKMIHSF